MGLNKLVAQDKEKQGTLVGALFLIYMDAFRVDAYACPSELPLYSSARCKLAEPALHLMLAINTG